MDIYGNLDYASAVTFTFVSPINTSTDAFTDFFSITTDMWGGVGNNITVSGYSIDGSFLGSISHAESPIGGVNLRLQDIGELHKVVISASSDF